MPNVITHLCDPCFVDGEEVVGEPTTLRVGDVERTVNVCPAHDTALLAPLRGLLADPGEPPTAAAPPRRRGARRRAAPEPVLVVAPIAEGEHLCGVAGCARNEPGKGLPTGTGRTIHRSRVHGIKPPAAKRPRKGARRRAA